jgi:hypothetical protein
MIVFALEVGQARENFTRVSSCANSPTNSKCTHTFEVGKAREKIAGLRELGLLELELEAPGSMFILYMYISSWASSRVLGHGLIELELEAPVVCIKIVSWVSLRIA